MMSVKQGSHQTNIQTSRSPKTSTNQHSKRASSIHPSIISLQCFPKKQSHRGKQPKTGKEPQKKRSTMDRTRISFGILLGVLMLSQTQAWIPSSCLLSSSSSPSSTRCSSDSSRHYVSSSLPRRDFLSSSSSYTGLAIAGTLDSR